MTAPESERRDTRSREQILARVRAEFSDMAGLSLTLPQARRLFHLNTSCVCDSSTNSSIMAS